ncbi:DNA primase large subunit PriL [Thermococcus sp.]|uniref:DNA primase large subunit PriL n=1 Tax=Thermococcus sp. TaxID=35749 RepID=UPI0025DC3C7F|nr:DNA primase large subunit PriL [Thermococcus sp.]
MLDPFGSRARELVKELGGIKAVLERIPSYIVLDHALRRVSWYKSGRVPDDVVTVDDLTDILTFYALLGALAFSPYGLEAELVKEANLKIYSKRIARSEGLTELSLPVEITDKNEIPVKDTFILEKRGERNLDPERKRGLELKYKVHLSSFLEFWDGSLKEVYIRNGYAYVTKGNVLKLWRKVFEHNTERAVNALYEITDELPDYYRKLREELGSLAREVFKERLGRYGNAEAAPLRFEFFPPCIKKAIGGVPAGLRNYAITVLLTSFLSYARICPNPPRRDVRVRDCIQDLGVLEREVIPLIIDAGNRCSPPLFEDQPHEIKNIWYHMGFGLTDRPGLEDSGSSPWYFPPNCDKIRANAPTLCNPDRDCRNIKNPLTYYLRKLYLENRRRQQEKGGETSEGGKGNG